jgi:hypothetical protein
MGQEGQSLRTRLKSVHQSHSQTVILKLQAGTRSCAESQEEGSDSVVQLHDVEQEEDVQQMEAIASDQTPHLKM